MSVDKALRELAERVSLICAANSRLRRRCAELEKQVEKLSRQIEKGGADQPTAEAGGLAPIDKETIKIKVEEMLAELADIG